MNAERIKQIAIKEWYKLWDVKPWQLLEIHEKIIEWNNERIWRFRWLVIKVKHSNLHSWTFTVRWKVLGITVEKVYPLNCPSIVSIKLLDQYRIRRAKLYFIRDKVWKAARLKSILDERWQDLQKKNIKILIKTETVEKKDNNKQIEQQVENNNGSKQSDKKVGKTEINQQSQEIKE